MDSSSLGTNQMQAIGQIKSLFKFKNGTPRQAGVCSTARGILTINKSIFNNPEHSLEGLEEFSHAWIIFLFHKNNNASVKAKVRPPRLNGKRIGVFATRAPYRPNPIGLTLAKIEKISGAEIHFSGIDLLDGTPVLDVKPYIPQYDEPTFSSLPFQTSCNFDHSLNNYPGTNTNQFVKTDQISTISKVKTDPDNQQHVDQVSSKQKREIELFNQFKPEFIQEKRSHEMPSSLKDDQLLQSSQAKTLRSDSKINTEKNCLVSANSADHLTNSVNKPDFKHPYPKKSHSKDNSTYDTYSLIEPNRQLEASTYIKSENSNSVKCLGYKEDKAYISSESSLSKDPNLEMKESPSTSIQVRNIPVSSGSSENPNSKCLVFQSNDTLLTNQAITASWVTQAPVSKLDVIFTERAKEQLLNFSPNSDDPAFRLKFLKNQDEVLQAISDILGEDPRSIYRRNTCKDSLYYFAVDSVHVTCWFFDCFVEILFIQPVLFIPQMKDL